MATYTLNYEKGKTKEKVRSVTIKLYVTHQGKIYQPQKTIKNHDNLWPSKMEKEAITCGETWEKEFRRNLLIGRSPQITSRALFSEIADKYLSIHYSQWAPLTLERNEYLIKGKNGLNFWFGNMQFSEISPLDVQEYIAYLNNFDCEKIYAVLKPNAKEKFNQTIKDHDLSVRALCNERTDDGELKFVSRPIFYDMQHFIRVEWNTAQIVCRKFGLNVSDTFERIVETKKYAENSVKKWKKLLSTIFNWGIKVNLCQTNYAGGVYTKGIKLGEKREQAEVLKDDEVDTLFETLKDVPIKDSLPIWTMAKLGISRAEFCGLNWDAVDLENKLLHIKYDRVNVKGKGVVLGDVKNPYRKRTLPLDDFLVAKFKEAKDLYNEHRASEPNFDKCGAVYYCWKQPREKDGAPKSPANLFKLLRELLADTQLTVVTPHRLRAGAITKMIREGVTADKIVPIVGHKDATMINQVYMAICKDMGEHRKALEKCY